MGDAHDQFPSDIPEPLGVFSVVQARRVLRKYSVVGRIRVSLASVQLKSASQTKAIPVRRRIYCPAIL